MPPKLLFVDDQELVLKSIERLLAKDPYELYTATSAHEALDLLKKEEIDVIVSDERMPSMSGSDLLGVVRRDYPDVVRIILTGYLDPDATVCAINVGNVSRYLLKPIKEKQLRFTIKQALLQRDMMRETRRLLIVAQKQRDLLREVNQTYLDPAISREMKEVHQGSTIPDAEKLVGEIRETIADFDESYGQRILSETLAISCGDAR